MKANIPKSWFFLPEKEKKIIAKMMEDEVNKTIDHEEAELQKRWLQLACIVLHKQKDPFGKMRCLAFLNGFKRIYKKCKRFSSDNEIKEWVDKELEPIFGSGGYPSDWVDDLENG